MAQEPDINIGAIAEQLNGKVDTDVGNTNATGNAVIANYAFPSEKFIDVTLGASDSTYTVPADGWFVFDMNAASAGQYIALIIKNAANNVEIYREYVTAMGAPTRNTLIAPVGKGMVIRYLYNMTGALNFFRFIYAKGNEPQS